MKIENEKDVSEPNKCRRCGRWFNSMRNIHLSVYYASFSMVVVIPASIGSQKADLHRNALTIMG